jgi:hypothetical protein
MIALQKHKQACNSCWCFSGISRAHVPLQEKGFMKDWTGFQTTFLARYATITPIFFVARIRTWFNLCSFQWFTFCYLWSFQLYSLTHVFEIAGLVDWRFKFSQQCVLAFDVGFCRCCHHSFLPFHKNCLINLYFSFQYSGCLFKLHQCVDYWHLHQNIFWISSK